MTKYEYVERLVVQIKADEVVEDAWISRPYPNVIEIRLKDGSELTLNVEQ